MLVRFAEGPVREMGITQIAGATDLSVSTAHRLVRALVAAGLLTQNHQSDRYGLGPLLVVLGRRAERHLGYDPARATLERLAAATGESVNLGVRAGSEVLVVLDVASDQPLRFDQPPGTRVPLHTSAMGKCLLAFVPDVEAEVRALPELTGVTARTITDPAALRAELDRVRSRGWALNDEERNAGVRAVAAPVLHEGRAVAALAVQGPKARLTDAYVRSVSRALTDAAAEIAPVLVPLR